MTTNNNNKNVSSYYNGFNLYYMRGYNTLVNMLNTLPTIVHNETIDMSNTIASRLHKCGDIFSGKSANTSKVFAQVEKKHFEVIQKIKTQQPDQYIKLTEFARLATSMGEQQQAELVIPFIRNFLKKQH